METKEEILKRNVESVAKCNVKYNVTHQGILNAMDEYATQCQEDNVNKKYTEEDIREAIAFGQGMELWKEEKQIEDFINSLNKQD